MLQRGVEHLAGLVGIPRHARLRQYVLAGVERGQRDRCVQVGPRGHDHRIDRRILDQLAPGCVRPAEVEFGPSLLRGARRAVHDTHQLHARNGLEARDVTRPGD
jgi:hypothetical protein